MGKPQQPTDCSKITMREEYDNGKHRGNNLLRSFLTTRRLQWKQRPLLSLSLYLYAQLRTIHIQLQNIQPHKLFCPKSYLYTYDFRVNYTYGPKGLTRTHSRLCPLQPAEEGYHQAFNRPVLLTSHPEGPVSQQTPPSLRHGM